MSKTGRMRIVRRTWTGAFAAVAFVVCGAQAQVPADTMARAAYCIEINEWELGKVRDVPTGMPDGPVKAQAQALILAIRRRLDVLRLYFATHLDTNNVLAVHYAQSSARGELQRINTGTSYCSTQCNQGDTTLLNQCLDSCIKSMVPDQEELKRKFSVCTDDLSWLP